MMESLKTLRPVNRHIVIVPHRNQNETQSGVLLPEDFVREENEDRYITATVVSVARDCSQAFQKLNSRVGEQKQIVVDRSMIEDIALGDKTYHIVLENYVIGILRGLNEV